MTERLIQIRENGRTIVRGITHSRASNRYELDINEGETLDVEVDFTPILGSGETLSDATVTNSGVTVAPTLATPKVTLRFSGMTDTYSASSKLTVTRSGGQVHRLYFIARNTADVARSYDYGRVL